MIDQYHAATDHEMGWGATRKRNEQTPRPHAEKKAYTLGGSN